MYELQRTRDSRYFVSPFLSTISSRDDQQVGAWGRHADCARQSGRIDNPVKSKPVADYPAFRKPEQQHSGVTVRQVVPMFEAGFATFDADHGPPASDEP